MTMTLQGKKPRQKHYNFPHRGRKMSTSALLTDPDEQGESEYHTQQYVYTHTYIYTRLKSQQRGLGPVHSDLEHSRPAPSTEKTQNRSKQRVQPVFIPIARRLPYHNIISIFFPCHQWWKNERDIFCLVCACLYTSEYHNMILVLLLCTCCIIPYWLVLLVSVRCTILAVRYGARSMNEHCCCCCCSCCSSSMNVILGARSWFESSSLCLLFNMMCYLSHCCCLRNFVQQ